MGTRSGERRSIPPAPGQHVPIGRRNGLGVVVKPPTPGVEPGTVRVGLAIMPQEPRARTRRRDARRRQVRVQHGEGQSPEPARPMSPARNGHALRLRSRYLGALQDTRTPPTGRDCTATPPHRHDRVRRPLESAPMTAATINPIAVAAISSPPASKPSKPKPSQKECAKSAPRAGKKGLRQLMAPSPAIKVAQCGRGSRKSEVMLARLAPDRAC